MVKLDNIKNKGPLPLEDVKDDVTLKARAAKKGEMFAAEFKAKAGASTNVNDIAAKMGLEVKKQDSIPASSHSVNGMHDDIFMGTITGIKAGQTSKVTIGNSGVFVASLNSVIEGKSMQSLKDIQKAMDVEFGGKSDYEVLNALKELANIEDHRSRID